MNETTCMWIAFLLGTNAYRHSAEKNHGDELNIKMGKRVNVIKTMRKSVQTKKYQTLLSLKPANVWMDEGYS